MSAWGWHRSCICQELKPIIYVVKGLYEPLFFGQTHGKIAVGGDLAR